MDDDASQGYDAEWDDSESIDDDGGNFGWDIRDFATPENTEDREPARWELDLAMNLSGDWDEYTLEQWSGGPRLANMDLPLQFCPFDLISDPE
ncbi:hypothetical protein NMY22_g15766 [Coprinellus aureogranulatus]|nr:hypothetical protein NMY22_g15766 [Coprinellus aureogranulatus]